jgi:4-hydroxy-tetrahydrodipicolinate reductase
MARIAIHGAAGRMGQRLIQLALADPDLELVAAVERAGHPGLDQPAGFDAEGRPSQVRLTDRIEGHPEVLIDFSTPQGTRQLVGRCAERGVALVVGTTGLTDDDQRLLDEAAHRVAVLHATNYSLVVNVLNHLAGQAAQLLGEGYDIEVLEAHHRFKKDAPSGTALTLARVLCEATGRQFDRDVRLARHGDDVPRQPEEITVQALRIGDHVGEHTVYLAGLGERLELKHVSTNRDSYAIGALRAARWLAGRAAGRYTMAQVLGLP